MTTSAYVTMRTNTNCTDASKVIRNSTSYSEMYEPKMGERQALIDNFTPYLTDGLEIADLLKYRWNWIFQIGGRLKMYVVYS